MANDNLSDISTKIALSPGGERTRSALGSAGSVAKPGDSVGIDSDGRVVRSDLGVSENFLGFLDINVETDIDTAIIQDVPCEIIIPQGGHDYAVHITDETATVLAGAPYGFSAGAGLMEEYAALNTAGVRASLADDIATGDDYGKITWGI